MAEPVKTATITLHRDGTLTIEGYAESYDGMTAEIVLARHEVIALAELLRHLTRTPPKGGEEGSTMSRTPMTTAEIAELNAAYDAARAGKPDELTNITTYDVAVDAGLIHVRHDDESGDLWRNKAGRHVYGWESGGFDDQVDDVE